MTKKNFYAVAVGRKTGIFTSWLGADGAKVNTDRFPHALYEGFATETEAQTWLLLNTPPTAPIPTNATSPPARSPLTEEKPAKRERSESPK